MSTSSSRFKSYWLLSVHACSSDTLFCNRFSADQTTNSTLCTMNSITKTLTHMAMLQVANEQTIIPTHNEPFVWFDMCFFLCFQKPTEKVRVTTRSQKSEPSIGNLWHIEPLLTWIYKINRTQERPHKNQEKKAGASSIVRLGHAKSNEHISRGKRSWEHSR